MCSFLLVRWLADREAVPRAMPARCSNRKNAVPPCEVWYGSRPTSTIPTGFDPPSGAGPVRSSYSQSPERAAVGAERLESVLGGAAPNGVSASRTGFWISRRLMCIVSVTGACSVSRKGSSNITGSVHDLSRSQQVTGYSSQRYHVVTVHLGPRSRRTLRPPIRADVENFSSKLQHRSDFERFPSALVMVRQTGCDAVWNSIDRWDAGMCGWFYRPVGCLDRLSGSA
jgi:hypothetical protein